MYGKKTCVTSRDKGKDLKKRTKNIQINNKTPAMHRDIFRLQLANYRRLIKKLLLLGKTRLLRI